MPTSKRLENLRERLRKERESSLRQNRWGEARRFAGRAAGNRLARRDHLQAMIDKEYRRLEI